MRAEHPHVERGEARAVKPSPLDRPLDVLTHMLRRKEQILDAAVECFVEKGFHQTSMKEVLTRSGLSAGAVYNHFPSKHAIIVALIERSIKDTSAAFQENAKTDTDTPLRRIFEANAIGALVDEDVLRRCILNIDGVAEGARDPEIRDLVRQDFQNAIEILTTTADRSKEAGELDSAVASGPMAQLLLAVSIGLLCMRLVDDELDSAAINDLLWRLVATGRSPDA